MLMLLVSRKENCEIDDKVTETSARVFQGSERNGFLNHTPITTYTLVELGCEAHDSTEDRSLIHIHETVFRI